MSQCYILSINFKFHGLCIYLLFCFLFLFEYFVFVLNQLYNINDVTRVALLQNFSKMSVNKVCGRYVEYLWVKNKNHEIVRLDLKTELILLPVSINN